VNIIKGYKHRLYDIICFFEIKIKKTRGGLSQQRFYISMYIENLVCFMVSEIFSFKAEKKLAHVRENLEVKQ